MQTLTIKIPIPISGTPKNKETLNASLNIIQKMVSAQPMSRALTG
jgi:hypothetical protein